MKIIFNKLKNILTKNKTRIPLFWVNFNYKKYKKFGNKDSCIIKIHPLLSKDLYIQNELSNLIDYIRKNYNMEDI